VIRASQWVGACIHSVDCTLACPSQSETFRRSFVPARFSLRSCGATNVERLASITGPDMLCSCTDVFSKNVFKTGAGHWFVTRVQNSSGAETVPLIVNHARRAAAVSFHKGRQRCLRPLPWTITAACEVESLQLEAGSCTSSGGSPCHHRSHHLCAGTTLVTRHHTTSQSASWSINTSLRCRRLFALQGNSRTGSLATSFVATPRQTLFGLSCNSAAVSL